MFLWQRFDTGEQYETTGDPHNWADLPCNDQAVRYREMFGPPERQQQANQGRWYDGDYGRDDNRPEGPADGPQPFPQRPLPPEGPQQPITARDFTGWENIRPLAGTVWAEQPTAPPMTAQEILAARDHLRTNERTRLNLGLPARPTATPTAVGIVQFVRAFRQERPSTKFSFTYIDREGFEKSALASITSQDGVLEDKYSVTAQIVEKLRRGPRRPLTTNIANDMFQLLTLIMDDEQLQKQYGNEWEAVVEAYEQEGD